MAFVSNNLIEDRERLLKAGATAVTDGIEDLPGGDAMTFVRDPWGITLQLVSRATPMLD
jgi:predicted enzyme related to lactoylglutathione lyase